MQSVTATNDRAHREPGIAVNSAARSRARHRRRRAPRGASTELAAFSRIATRKRQRLVWLAHAPGWDGVLDTLSVTAELHGPPTLTVTWLEDRHGHLDFKTARQHATRPRD